MSDLTVTPLDWSAIDTVLLDMDGTLLDLKFDNHFWREILPAHYGALHGLTLEEAKTAVRPIFLAKRGTLDWYCIDFWSRELNLDVLAIKRTLREDVRWLPAAEAFVLRLRKQGKRMALVTNAHPDALAVKDEQLDFKGHFDAVYSTHPFGVPKEDAAFWPRLAAVEPFNPARTLFVDDSLPVLQAARNYGIKWVYAIAQPDSSRPRRAIEEFPSVTAIGELL